jgi:hypothetical protein
MLKPCRALGSRSDSGEGRRRSVARSRTALVNIVSVPWPRPPRSAYRLSGTVRLPGCWHQRDANNQMRATADRLRVAICHVIRRLPPHPGPRSSRLRRSTPLQRAVGSPRKSAGPSWNPHCPAISTREVCSVQRRLESRVRPAPRTSLVSEWFRSMLRSNATGKCAPWVTSSTVTLFGVDDSADVSTDTLCHPAR